MSDELGYVAQHNGIIQHGFFATGLEELELIANELIGETATRNMLAGHNGWRIRPVKLVFLDEPQRVNRELVSKIVRYCDSALHAGLTVGVDEIVAELEKENGK